MTFEEFWESIEDWHDLTDVIDRADLGYRRDYYIYDYSNMLDNVRNYEVSEALGNYCWEDFVAMVRDIPEEDEECFYRQDGLMDYKPLDLYDACEEVYDLLVDIEWFDEEDEEDDEDAGVAFEERPWEYALHPNTNDPKEEVIPDEEISMSEMFGDMESMLQNYTPPKSGEPESDEDDICEEFILEDELLMPF